MGYRSDVKLITTKEGWERIDKAVRKAENITQEDIDAGKYWLTDENCWGIICDGHYIIAEWEDIKWYDWGGNDVSTFMKELSKLDDDDIPYEFMRVGEDYEDVEYLYYSSSEYYEKYKDMPSLGLKREIEVNY